VVMKRDLQSRRRFRRGCCRGRPRRVQGGVAFATRGREHVAGDYYDVYCAAGIRGKTFLIAVADVAGQRAFRRRC